MNCGGVPPDYLYSLKRPDSNLNIRRDILDDAGVVSSKVEIRRATNLVLQLQ